MSATVFDWQTDEEIRIATKEEEARSFAAAEKDGGVGCWTEDDGTIVYVSGKPMGNTQQDLFAEGWDTGYAFARAEMIAVLEEEV